MGIEESERFRFLQKLTSKSSQTGYVMATALVSGTGNILAVGTNRKTYGRLILSFLDNCQFHSLHAEVDALRKVHPKHLGRATMYIFGQKKKVGGKCGSLLLSKPCRECQKDLGRYPNLRTFYHDTEGQIHELVLDSVRAV